LGARRLAARLLQLRLGWLVVHFHAWCHSQWPGRANCRRVVISPSSSTRCGLRWIGPLLTSSPLAICFLHEHVPFRLALVLLTDKVVFDLYACGRGGRIVSPLYYTH
jgi:hypothetical protein